MMTSFKNVYQMLNYFNAAQKECRTDIGDFLGHSASNDSKGVSRGGYRQAGRWPNRTAACAYPGTPVHPRIPYEFDEAMGK